MPEANLADIYAVVASIDEKLAWQNLALKKIVDAAVDITAKPAAVQPGTMCKMKDPTVDPTFPDLKPSPECLRRGHVWSGPEEIDNRWCLRCGAKVNV